MQDQMSNIIEEYKKAKPIYEEYTQKMYKLIYSLTNESEIKTHSVDWRVLKINKLTRINTGWMVLTAEDSV